MLTKGKLLNILESKLTEMPVDYGNKPERMSPDLEDKLANKEHPFKDNPAIPQTKPEGQPSNFEELISSKRFADVVEKVKHFTNLQGNITTQNSFAQLQNLMARAHFDIIEFERNHKPELEQLALDLVKKEMAIPEGAFQYDIKITGDEEEISKDEMKMDSENPSDEEVEEQFGVSPEQAANDVQELMDAFQVFDAEVAKRRFLNALIQGASKKGHYMYQLVGERLNQMDPTIMNKYGTMMSVNDLMYWVIPDETLNMAQQSGPLAGREQVKKDTDPPTIFVRAVNFPVLIHELIKAVMEAMATKGLPDDRKSAEMVMGAADTLPAETWDLRFGPYLWEKLRSSYPERIYQDDLKHIQNYLFARFAALDTKEFNELAKMVMSDNPRGKQIIERMVQDIERHLANEDWEEEQYNNEWGDEENEQPDVNLKDLLGDMGISLPDEDDDED
jgi:hypothetical protein